MGEIVAAFASSHAPLLTAAPEAADPAQTRPIYEALQQLREQLSAARPDALVVCSNEHFTNFFFDNYPPFCIGIGEAHEGPVEDWLKIEKCMVPGAPALGRELLTRAYDEGFDPAFSEELRLDHGIMTLLHFLTPDMTLPVVPIIQNCSVVPMPAVQRCYQFGAFLARAIAAQNAVPRVALLAAGGLSHWVGAPHMGEINDGFDRAFLDLLAGGRGRVAAGLSNEQIEQAGNGAHEIRSWITLAGAMGPRPAKVLAYAPVHAWITGMGVLSYDL